MTSLDKPSFTQGTESNENSIENDLFAITNRCGHNKV